MGFISPVSCAEPALPQRWNRLQTTTDMEIWFGLKEKKTWFTVAFSPCSLLSVFFPLSLLCNCQDEVHFGVDVNVDARNVQTLIALVTFSPGCVCVCVFLLINSEHVSSRQVRKLSQTATMLPQQLLQDPKPHC